MEKGQENEKVLAQSNDNLFFMTEIERSVSGFMRSILVELEMLLPHKKDDGSDNEIKFSNLRRHVLRLGNDRVRLMREVLKDYSIKKVYDSETMIIFQEKGKGN